MADDYFVCHLQSKTSSLASSLSSSTKGVGGANGRSLLGKIGGGSGLGTVELDSVKISNQYEEEEEEEEEGSSEFDSEQGSSESVRVYYSVGQS